jgi:antitoxin Phd
MVQIWQLQEAKARLSEVVRLCVQEGPQILTVRGKEEVVILSKQEYELLIGSKPNLFEFMRHSPLKGLEISFERDQSSNREINL